MLEGVSDLSPDLQRLLNSSFLFFQIIQHSLQTIQIMWSFLVTPSTRRSAVTLAMVLTLTEFTHHANHVHHPSLKLSVARVVTGGRGTEAVGVGDQQMMGR